MPHVHPEPTAPKNSGSPSSLGGKPAPMPELKHVDPPQSSVDDNMSIGTADKPHAMPDVQFDDGASDNLRNALNSAADTIETQQGGRDGLFDTARDKFEGKYAHDFHMCHVQLANNSANVVAMLRYGAKLVDYIKECAHVENENRKKAREWENRNGVQQAWDGVVLNKHRPDYAPNPSKPAEPGSAPQRDVNAGAPDASGGTSSAIPENLDGYNTACVSYDNEAGLKHTDITNALNTYTSSCHHGSLDISETINSMAGWLQQSNQVNTWVSGVAQDFRDAGSGASKIKTVSNAYLDQRMQERGTGAPQVQKIEVHPAQVTGEIPTSGFANDPVNVATGNFIEPETDLSFPGTFARNLNLKRMYNSLAVTNSQDIPSGVFGIGWSSTLDQRLEFDADKASWFTADGRILTFAREGEGFARASGEAWWLTRAEPGSDAYARVEASQRETQQQLKKSRGLDESADQALTQEPFYWIVMNNAHESFGFSASGDWVSATDGHPSNTVVAFRDAQGQVTDLVHPGSQRGIRVDYEELVQSTKAPEYRPISAYIYNTAGAEADTPLMAAEYSYEGEHLTSVTTNAGVRSYTHTDAGLIREVINANGIVEVTNTYDELGRVVHQLTEYGHEVSYTYTPSLVTIVADAETGDNSNLWTSDSKGRLIGITATDGSRQTMRYDSFGNRVGITERDGSRTTRVFDNRGRLKRERTPEGTDYTYGWDEHDRITGVSVRDARDPRNLGTPMTVSYEYTDSMNPNPSAVTDADGAQTLYDWDDRGLLTRVTDPTGVSTTFEYDAYGDLVLVTNGAGNTTTLIRDDHGRVIGVIDPLGRRGTATYNSSGALASIENADGARWTFAYPELAVESLPALVRNSTNTSGGCGNLPTSVTDPYGATIRFTYNAGGEIASVTNPLGHTTEGTFDTWGNLVGLTTASGAVWKYVYDGLSQLVEATDPSGAATRYSYDLNGELSSVTDATGVEIKRRVDRQRGIEEIADAFSSSFIHTDIFGRVTSEQKRARGGSSATRADVESEFITYDAAGRPVEILDAAGGLTCYERDGAGRVLRVISAAGRIETYEYDAAGRVISHAVGLDTPGRYTDEAGVLRVVEPSAWAITRLEYDAASQIIRRVNPDGSVEKITYDVCGRVTGVESGVRVASYEYDLCGRLIGVRDSAFGQRRFKYDAAGQIIQAADGLGFRTHFSYTATGQVCRVVDATGQVTDYEYDALDRLVRVIKAAGTVDESVQEYAYDAAGRLIRAHDGVREYTHTYDYAAGGRLSHTCVDGVKAAEFGIEDQGRTVWVRDYASAQALDGNASEDAFVQHRFVYDARGLLMERSRSGVMTDTAGEPSGTADVDAQVQALNTFTNTGAYTLTLGYDADGYRTRMVTPYGETAIAYDGAGRVVSMSRADQDAHGESPVAQYSYDAMGRLIRAQLGDILSRWEFDDVSGLVCSYSRENTARADSVEHTEVIRDEQGRIVGLDSADGLVVYTYDAAGQLTGSRSGDLEFEWVFEAGLMVSERTWRHSGGTGEPEETSRVLSGERSFAYNRLNQLTEIIATDRTVEHMFTTVTTYEYNAAGERTREIITDDRGVQRVREYAWGAYSGLASVTDTYVTAHGGEAASRVRMVTDVTGELAQVAGGNGVSTPLLWDPDAAMPQILGAGGMPAPGSDGGFSQVGIAGGFDPWAVPSMLGSAPDAQGMNIPGLPLTSSADDSGVWGSMLPAGFSFTGAGSVRVAGLDVMGARVFDGVSKRFLSTDPLAQVPGTGFFADVYAFCGNNPVGLMDPWGLKPMSPDEFQKYSRDKAWKDFGDYVAAGAMLFVGLALTAAAVATGPLGMVLLGAASGALMSGGMSVITQKMEGKDVDWSTVGRDALIGGLAGAAGGVVGGIFAKGAAVAKSMATAEKAAETGSKSVSRIVQMGVKASDKINAGITRIGNTKVVSAARNNKYINGASNWVGDKLYGKTFEGGVDELSGKVIGAGLQEGAKDATISSVKYAATTDQWNPKDQAVAGVMGFAGGFVFGGVGGGINHGMAASADLAKESGKTVGKLNSPYIRNYANDWVTSNGADAMALGLDQKMSAEEKAQKMVQKVGVNTAKSAFTAGAKTYGGKIKDARENASTP
ncbi:RHS family protein, partial [Rothia aeria F0474]